VGHCEDPPNGGNEAILDSSKNSRLLCCQLAVKQS